MSTSLRALARMLGVTDRAVRNGRRTGRLPAALFDQAGRVRDVEAAVLAWQRNRTKLAPNGAAPAPGEAPESDRAVVVPLAGPIARLAAAHSRPDLRVPAAHLSVLATPDDVALVVGVDDDAAVYPMSAETALSLGAALIRHAYAGDAAVIPSSPSALRAPAAARKGRSSSSSRED